MPRAPAAALIACGILVGIAVGTADWNIFCTAAGTSVPRSVPFAMASVKWLVGSIYAERKNLRVTVPAEPMMSATSETTAGTADETLPIS
jgi:hypothetical protein